MNQSGTDDLVTRFSVLYLMAILVGYSANASAIDLTHHVSATAEAAAETVASNVTETVGHLVRRAAEAAATEDHADGYKALVASTAFFMAGRGLRRRCIPVAFASVLNPISRSPDDCLVCLASASLCDGILCARRTAPCRASARHALPLDHRPLDHHCPRLALYLCRRSRSLFACTFPLRDEAS